MDEKEYSLSDEDPEQNHLQKISRLTLTLDPSELKGAKADEAVSWNRGFISRSGVG